MRARRGFLIGAWAPGVEREVFGGNQGVSKSTLQVEHPHVLSNHRCGRQARALGTVSGGRRVSEAREDHCGGVEGVGGVLFFEGVGLRDPRDVVDVFGIVVVAVEQFSADAERVKPALEERAVSAEYGSPRREGRLDAQGA